MQKYATAGHLDIAGNRRSPRVASHGRPTSFCAGRARPVQNVGMASKRPVVSPEDQALFLSAIDGTVPLGGRERDRIAAPPPLPSPVPRVEHPPTRALTVEGDGGRYSARAAGVSRAQIAELRGGKVHVDETLDLHGDTVEAGLLRLRAFLAAAHRIRRCVLIIHGRGLHSEQGAPLREAVLSELLGPMSGYVHALATAAPSHGGDGATCVVLAGGR
jgi:DNA-nicking Smr family endonuclease